MQRDASLGKSGLLPTNGGAGEAGYDPLNSEPLTQTYSQTQSVSFAPASLGEGTHAHRHTQTHTQADTQLTRQTSKTITFLLI